MTISTKTIAIVAAEFNTNLIQAMIEAANLEIEIAGATMSSVVKVPGCYEIPLSAELQLAKDEVNAVVVLGYIERGDTLHGEVMGQVVHDALVRIQLKYRKPIGIGIIGPGATEEQAEVRKSNYARAAVRAALRMSDLIGQS